ncbi:MAG: sigma-70 family RNA polymerase sigma factor [Pseudomonadota bacterium]
MTGSGEGLRLLTDSKRAEAAEWRQYRARPSSEARAALFARFSPVAERTARKEHSRISGMGLEASDCSQIAYESLLDCIERFHPHQGVPFPSFARPRIVGAIRNALTKANEARAAYAARVRAKRDRLASLKRQADKHTDDDTMEALREIVVGMALGFMLEENAEAEMERVPSDTPSAFDGAAWNQLVRELEDRLSNLPDPEKSVMEYHYKKGLRFAHIATLLGLSRSRISQIHSKALTQLRRSLSKFR